MRDAVVYWLIGFGGFGIGFFAGALIVVLSDDERSISEWWRKVRGR